MSNWIGKEFLIKVRVLPYNFKNTTDSELLGGGSSIIQRGYVYQIKNIKMA
jgi:hypothetical protein